MQFIINVDSFGEFSQTERSTQHSRPRFWRWVLLSVALHIGLLMMVLQFSQISRVEKDNSLSQTPRPVINAQLLFEPNIERPIQDVSPQNTISNVTPEPAQSAIKNEEIQTEPVVTQNADSTKPELVSQTLIETRPVVAEPEVAEPEMNLPEQSFSFNQAKPLILNSSQSRLLSDTTRRSEVQAFFNEFNSQASQQNAQQSSQQFATAQISPELFAGAPILTAAQQDAKQLFKAKIDVDCASDLNKVIATISQFTIQAVVCQDKGNIDAFIQQRIAKKDSQERLKGLKPPAQRD